MYPSRFVRAGLLRAMRQPTGSKAFTPRFSSAFHTSSIKSEEEKKAEVTAPAEAESIVSKFGLDDWKISAPVGIAVAIPALENGIYVLNEETQLAACFFLFCTSVYKFGGDMIASYFDTRADAILREHNQVEDANIAMAKETLEAHKQTLGLHDDITELNKAYKEAITLLCETESLRLHHQMRDVFAKNLEAIVEAERGFTLKLQKDLVSRATEKVTEELTSGGKAAKEAAFKTALAALGETKKSEKNDEQDPMVTLFIKHMRSYAENLEQQEGKTVSLSAAEIEEFQGELDAYMKRHDMEAAELKAPKEVTLKLIK